MYLFPGTSLLSNLYNFISLYCIFKNVSCFACVILSVGLGVYVCMYVYTCVCVRVYVCAQARAHAQLEERFLSAVLLSVFVFFCVLRECVNEWIQDVFSSVRPFFPKQARLLTQHNTTWQYQRIKTRSQKIKNISTIFARTTQHPEGACMPIPVFWVFKQWMRPVTNEIDRRGNVS